MSSLGPTEIILILVVILLLFGASRLPKLARSLGQASKEFKQGVSQGAQDDDEDSAKAEKPKADASAETKGPKAED